jgi:hypothetical protein
VGDDDVEAAKQIFPPGRLLLIHKASHMYDNQAWMFDADCKEYDHIELRYYAPA